jgi:hypothetical protein
MNRPGKDGRKWSAPPWYSEFFRFVGIFTLIIALALILLFFLERSLT